MIVGVWWQAGVTMLPSGRPPIPAQRSRGLGVLRQPAHLAAGAALASHQSRPRGTIAASIATRGPHGRAGGNERTPQEPRPAAELAVVELSEGSYTCDNLRLLYLLYLLTYLLNLASK